MRLPALLGALLAACSPTPRFDLSQPLPLRVDPQLVERVRSCSAGDRWDPVLAALADGAQQLGTSLATTSSNPQIDVTVSPDCTDKVVGEGVAGLAAFCPGFLCDYGVDFVAPIVLHELGHAVGARGHLDCSAGVIGVMCRAPGRTPTPRYSGADLDFICRWASGGVCATR